MQAPKKKIPGLECILLIDDDEITNLIHKRVIETAGVDVRVAVARSGQEGLDYLTGHSNGEYLRPGIIFLDINMPVMNGWKFLEKYHELPEDKKVKAVIIMLTTSVDPEDRRKADINPEVSNLISKTLTRQKLSDIIAEHFSD